MLRQGVLRLVCECGRNLADARQPFGNKITVVPRNGVAGSTVHPRRPVGEEGEVWVYEDPDGNWIRTTQMGFDGPDGTAVPPRKVPGLFGYFVVTCRCDKEHRVRISRIHDAWVETFKDEPLHVTGRVVKLIVGRDL